MSPSSISPELQSRLKQMSARLLDLHKILLDGQRARYEREHGAVTSPNELLGLVLNHEQFEWLRQLSGLIVVIDEMTSRRSKATEEDAANAIAQARGLLQANENGSDFARRYWQAIQESPDVAIAHASVLRMLQ